MDERTTYYVSTHGDGGREVRTEGASRASSVHRTKSETIASAKEWTRGQHPSQLLVYKQNGTVHTELSYGQDIAPLRRGPTGPQCRDSTGYRSFGDRRRGWTKTSPTL